MAEPEQRAVVAHEWGHLHHFHTWWLLLGMITMSTVATLLLAPLTSYAAMLAFPLALYCCFGPLSRMFERQADRWAARHTSSADMAQALLRVAQIAGIPPRYADMRHGSIVSRIEVLQQEYQFPRLGRFRDRLVHAMRFVMICVLLALALGASQLMPQFINPIDRLEQDQSTAAFVTAAREGDYTALVHAIRQHDLDERDTLARSSIKYYITQSLAKSHNDRWLLVSIAQAGLSDDLILRQFHNLVVYALVAGVPWPEDRDVTIAAELAQPLWDVVSDATLDPDGHIVDTLACLAYQQGDFEKAAELFSISLDRLKESKNESPDFEALLAHRLKLAQLADSYLPLLLETGAAAPGPNNRAPERPITSPPQQLGEIEADRNIDA